MRNRLQKKTRFNYCGRVQPFVTGVFCLTNFRRIHDGVGTPRVALTLGRYTIFLVDRDKYLNGLSLAIKSHDSNDRCSVRCAKRFPLRGFDFEHRYVIIITIHAIKMLGRQWNILSYFMRC